MVQFDFAPVRVSAGLFQGAVDSLIADVAVFEAGCNAEVNGYAAVCVDTISDAGVDALRAHLDIPVVGPGRTAFLLARQLGDRFSILTLWDGWKAGYVKTLQRYGLVDSLASIRSVGVEPDLRNLLEGKLDVIPRLIESATDCVEKDGADVVILGSTTMHEAHAAISEALSAPVINPGPAAFKLAEALLALGLTQSRTAHPRSSPGSARTVTELVAGHAPSGDWSTGGGPARTIEPS
jgi:allantoin racemase